LQIQKLTKRLKWDNTVKNRKTYLKNKTNEKIKHKSMKTKTFIFILAAFLSLQAIGQENTNKLDLRLGTGVSLLGSGDMITFNFENELNVKINQYFSSSASINLGRSNYGVSETASFVQGNLNVFFSPLKNNKRFDFRVGTGLSYYNISVAYESSQYWENGVLVDTDYEFDNRNSLGFNIIIENSYLITDKFLVGLKLFTQPYNNGDINSGVMLKFGLIL
jgi:hypothetical protein